MDFYEVLDQVIDLLRNRGRVSYRALQRQFDLDDNYVEDLKVELIDVQELATDRDNKMLVWAGESEGTSAAADQSVQTSDPSAIDPGQPVHAKPPRSAPHTPDAERRQLTVMFCDLADSTKLSGQLDLEDLRDVIRAYQSTSAEVIERYDGYIAQHLGDGLMVYFGWPQAHEDDAQRAVHAGLGILEAMGQLNARLEREKGIRLEVRLGIHTGLVVVGEIGQGASQEHLALGETPNIASRIEGVAVPDTVAISEATYQLVQGFFVCEDLGQHALKGVNEPQQVYRVIKEGDAQSRLDVAVTRGLTPLVGRESESMLLLERWDQVKAGQGQVVLLSGEAGIGKSRLLQVLRDHVAITPHTRLECRSSPYYQNTALYPISGMLQRMFQWHQDDTPEAKLDKLEQTLRAYRLALDAAMPLFANLLSLSILEDRYPPLTMSPQRQRQRTLETIVAMLLQEAEEQPVLFILEDLHWTDPSTLELLDLLIDQTPTAAIYVLLTSRPTFQPTWSSRSYLTPIVLNRLSRSQIENMAERVAGGKRLPTDVMQQIVEKTDGVPLFVEEMTKAVLESGALKDVDGQYELAGSFSALTIPATLQDSLMARLDRLVTAKGVAQYAAVIGRQFSFDLLAAVCQLDAAMLQYELGRLVEAELLYQRGLPPRATYVFKHALIQDTAYESLLKSTRQQYHQRIAQVLENQFPETAETQPELLAHHYTEAGHEEQAIPYWQHAGQYAIERSAHLEAVSHLSKGLQLLAGLPDTPEHTQRELQMQTALGAVYIVTKGHGAPEVERAYERARQLCLTVEDAAALFPVLIGLSRFYLVRAALQPARELGAQLLRLAQHDQDPTRLAGAYWAVWLPEFYSGEFSQVNTRAAQGLALYDRQQHRDQVLLYGIDLGVVCLEWAALSAWCLGYPDRARWHQHDALTMAQDLAHPYSLATALVISGWLHQMRGEERLTQKRADAAIVLCREQGFGPWLGMGTVLKGWALAERSQNAPDTVQMPQQGLATWRSTGAAVGQTYWLSLLVEAYRRQGQTEAAMAVVDETLALAATTGECFWEAELRRLKGELLLKASFGMRLAALTPEDCFQRALDVARHQQAKSLELRAATSLARLWQSQGKRQAAYDLVAPVYGWFTEGFDTAGLKEAKALLDELA